jgi:hypothetical protein
MTDVTLPLGRISDWASFHSVSAEVFGFPHFYGHNNNAWIDCLRYLADGDGMSKFHLVGDDRLVIRLPGFKAFQQTHGDIASGLLDCVDAVNSDYIARGEIPRLVLVAA